LATGELVKRSGVSPSSWNIYRRKMEAEGLLKSRRRRELQETRVASYVEVVLCDRGKEIAQTLLKATEMLAAAAGGVTPS